MFPNKISTINKLLKNVKRKSYQRICHFEGAVHEASYIFVGKSYSQLATVGSPKDNCMGLCGKYCKKGVGKDIYTQECFDHDLCHRKTKSFFGCFGELVRAIPGFFFGDDCSL